MELKEILSNTKEHMAKTLDHFKSQLGKVRTGRATASLLDGVTFDMYGTPSPISQGATIAVPDARTIVIQPWDRSVIGSIEKAILASDLGFNPQNDGTVIRVPVPPLTEERRKEFVKICKKYAEDNKVAIRNIRRDMIDQLKKSEKDKVISEDTRKDGEDEVQKITDTFIKDIDGFLAKKEKELLED